MSAVEILSIRRWGDDVIPRDRDRALEALEAGRIVFLPQLVFDLTEAERRFLSPSCSDGKAKNISFDPRTGSCRGSSHEDEALRSLTAMLSRFSGAARRLVEGICPDYAPHLEAGRTSFRPVPIDDRPTSYRKDDRRLHVDAFPSQPNQGRRILRVFSNVNPEGAARIWHIGEPFGEFAVRFLPRVRRPWPGEGWVLQQLRITKERRTPYDHIMLELHDRAKADLAYQGTAPRQEFAFPAGSSWIVFTDQVLHAAVAGQHALEQTFYLDTVALRAPAQSPLHTLERLTKRRLTSRAAGPAPEP